MKQIVAIFRKDVRHLCPEILVSLALQSALIILYPRQWAHADFHHEVVSYSFMALAASPDLFTSLLILLIPISWWVLVARLVHEERLVGNTQFWVTRPYQWPLLLGAKALFVGAFVYLPFVIIQCILLRVAGFNPLAHVPGLLFNAVLLTGLLVLPLMALSVLTSNLARMTLIILGFVVYVAGLVTASNLIPRLASSPSLVTGFVSFVVAICGAAAVIVVQYARRRTRTAWIVAAATVLLLGSTAFYDADQPFMNGHYPAASQNAAPLAQITYGSDSMHKPFSHETSNKGIVEVALPVHVDGVASGSVLIPTARKVTLDRADGVRWESPWQQMGGEKLVPGLTDIVLRLAMPRAIFDQFRNGPVALHLTLAIDQGRAIRTSTIALPAARFEVPGFGICTPETGWDGEPITVGIGCLAPMRQPDLTYITAVWHDKCLTSDSAERGPISGYGWTGALDPAPAAFSLTGVWSIPIDLTNSFTVSNQNDDRRVHMRQLCPGTPITFTTYALATRTRLELSVPDFRLPAIANASVAIQPI
ncbi:hypothetical protein [Occallatibacter riparius]|uniref:Uncharacterized protein n=1 Tax=Occallatibacter riparius TaxID=1002689 RepID=A0A9J7BJ87_9BACT|nr:hypothetical protein [Occallatibacter riparius]UWZ82743.1 hypothetical protein MOP44_19490 [Occallatibacter riparius]